MLQKQFVSRLRSLLSVNVEMINTIRTQCRRCGWEYIGAPDQQQDASEFFSFLYSTLGGQVSFVVCPLPFSCRRAYRRANNSRAPLASSLITDHCLEEAALLLSRNLSYWR